MTPLETDKQKLFDTAVRTLALQGGKAWAGACKYRTPSGRKCGVGAVLPDDVAQVLIDHGVNGKRIEAIMMHAGIHDMNCLRTWKDREMIGFLTDLQMAHDCAETNSTDAENHWINAYDPKGIAHRFLGVASKYSLNADSVALNFPQ